MATNGGNGARATGPRCVALVGPFQSGKTTLLEAILGRTGAIQRQGTVEAGNTVGDASKEARHHKMSVELTVATTNFMGDTYTFLDCPGSVEFVHDMRAVLPAVDAAVVVCEADEKKVPQLQLILRELEDKKIPRFLFLNKIDKADAGVHDVLKLLQPASRHRCCCARFRLLTATSSPASSISRWNAPLSTRSTRRPKSIPLEGDAADLEKNARFSMLETLADHDDELMEQLLEDIQPPRDRVFDDLTRELREGLVCPVLIGYGDPRQRRAAADEGAAPRIARHRGNREAPRRESRQRSRRLCVEDAEHRPRRQDVGRARACRPGRRRHDAVRPVTTKPAASPACSSCSARPPRSAARPRLGETVALGKLDEAKTGDTLSVRQAGRMPRSPRSSPIRRCSPSRSRPRSARTTSSSAWP